jgi:hypothetical protein
MKKLLIFFVTIIWILCSAALCMADEFGPSSLQCDSCTVSMTIPIVSANAPAAVQDTARQEIALADLETGTPRIEIPETFFDFGELNDGDDYVHSFTVRNLGTGVLQIEEVLPG